MGGLTQALFRTVPVTLNPLVVAFSMEEGMVSPVEVPTRLLPHSAHRLLIGASVAMSQRDPSPRLHFIYVANAGVGLPLRKFFIGEEVFERQISVTRRRRSSEATAAVAKAATWC